MLIEFISVDGTTGVGLGQPEKLFAIEHNINGRPPDERRALRQERSKPLVVALEAYLREQRAQLSPDNDLAKAIRTFSSAGGRSRAFATTDGICVSNNAGERALRGVALGRWNWTFAGSDAGGRRAAAVYSLIERTEAGTAVAA
jgi:transposase